MDITNPICVVLSGGVALGSYQAGAFEALQAEAGLEVGWVAGSSVGTLNSAMIAGSAPDRRLDVLQTYWLRARDGPCRPAWRQPAASGMRPTG